MSRRIVAVLAVAGVFALAGCPKKSDKGKPGAGTVHRDKVPLPITLDGTEVAKEAELSEDPRPLTEVVPGAPPLDKWAVIEVTDLAGATHGIMSPATAKPGVVPMISVGKCCVYVGWGEKQDDRIETKAVRVLTTGFVASGGGAGGNGGNGGGGGGGGGGSGDNSGGGGGEKGGARPTPTADLTFTIETAKGDTTFTGDRLVPLPELKAPMGDTETPGWNFRDVMKVAGIADAKSLHLTDAEGATLQLEGADLDPAQTVLYMKLNKSGVIRFRMFRKKGAGWEVGGELRGITKVKVLS